jgi:hypothetical protein
MPFDLRTILAPQNLLGLVQSIKGGVPELLPPGLFSKVRPTVGNTGSYRRVMATRQLAPVVQYGAPPVPVNGQDVIEVSEKLVHTIVSKPFDASFYNNLQGLSDITAQRYAEDVVTYETAELKRRVTNLMAACKYSVLSQGVIYVDHTQQFAFGSSGSQYAIDFGVPTSNQTDIATFTGVTGLWSNSDTDIPLQLRTLKQLAVQATGYPITHCLYGKSIPDYIQNNTAVADLVRGNYVLATEQYRTTEIPPMLGDINWLPMYSAFAEDSTGAQYSLWPDNLAVFIPDPADDWQEMLEGTRRIPTTFGAVGGDALSVLQTGVDAQGLFSYASVDRHLIVEQTVGNTFLPVLKVPAAIYQLTVA